MYKYHIAEMTAKKLELEEYLGKKYHMFKSKLIRTSIGKGKYDKYRKEKECSKG